jgi:hypothetical protein
MSGGVSPQRRLLVGEPGEHLLAFGQRRQQVGVLDRLAVALLARRAFVVEKAEGAHGDRGHPRHAAQQGGLLLAQALAAGPRQHQQCAGRMVERHRGRRSHSHPGHRQLTRGGDRLQLRDGGRALRIADRRQHLAAGDDGGDLGVERLRGSFDCHQRRFGLRLRRRHGGEELRELLRGPGRHLWRSTIALRRQDNKSQVAGKAS